MSNINEICQVTKPFWYPYTASYHTKRNEFVFSGCRVDANGITTVRATSEGDYKYTLFIQLVHAGKLVIAYATVNFNFSGVRRATTDSFVRSVKAQALKLHREVVGGSR